MSLPTHQHFVQVTPEAFKRLADELDAFCGIQLSGPSGSATHAGFGFDWDYNEAAQTLEIGCFKKPFLIPESTIMHAVTEHVSQAMTPPVLPTAA